MIDDLLLLADRFKLPLALYADAAGALFVDFAQAGAVGEDLAAERKIRTFHLIEQLGDGHFWIVDEHDRGLDDVARGCAAECWSPCRPQSRMRR